MLRRSMASVSGCRAPANRSAKKRRRSGIIRGEERAGLAWIRKRSGLPEALLLCERNRETTSGVADESVLPRRALRVEKPMNQLHPPGSAVRCAVGSAEAPGGGESLEWRWIRKELKERLGRYW